jgi:hypothetical protein
MSLKDMAHMTYKFMVRGYNPPESSTATRWTAGTATEYIGYASNDDRTSWTWYDRIDDGTPDALDIAYGKDSSGNGIYVVSNDSSTKELSVSSTDVTDGNAWTHKDLSGTGNDQFVVAWTDDSSNSTAGTWMAVGQNGGVFRSTDGASTWSEIDMSGITGHDTTKITALAGDGSGNWIICQEDRIYSSTNNGSSFSLAHTLSGESITKITGAAYTNSSWVISYERSTASSKTFLRSCAAGNLTSWSSEGGGTDSNGTLSNYGSGNLGRTTIAASEGRIVILPHNRTRIGYADVSGTTISNFTTVNLGAGGDNLRDVATDGTTWLICAQDGDLWESTDSGESWSIIATNLRNSTDDVQCITADVYLPQ